ncbi:SDR family oxidoreductase [Hoyosella altamirensis]|uniref:NAD(P)-dependent dehydrogenase (Short-subunit alcohol dehydrogenase family) n=1 Tax=Hoyosella altamirensis TaxID=616997 RepID=A0A839RL17_9ACTN|nr:SDR family oxidoreductase [Hoyosella altamirensis]MBB3036806.1 NAD(P)-dependent dehydrogenase (short-subunit alcohol dehydrogenase family) [Hoyosella altamirensis]
MDLNLSGRTIIVTGASSGVGLATTRLLLAEGAQVAACARDGERLRTVLSDLPGASPHRLFTASCDVTDRDSAQRFTDAVLGEFGAIDGLVCNAGRSLMATLDDTDDQAFRDEFELKIFGSWNMVRAARKALAASGAGSVVNVNAILSRQPESRLAATSAARAALLNLTHTLAETLAEDGTRVNSVLLGLIDTGQWRRRFESSGTTLSYDEWSAEIAANRGIALGRFGNADEVAFHIVTLLSPRSSYTTAATIDVGGGVARYV